MRAAWAGLLQPGQQVVHMEPLGQSRAPASTLCHQWPPLGGRGWTTSGLVWPGSAGEGLALTCPVEVDHQAVPHVLLDELQGPLEDLSCPGLSHCVGVPRVPEQGQQVIGRAWTAGRIGERGAMKQGTGADPLESTRAGATVLYRYAGHEEVPYLTHPQGGQESDRTDRQSQETLGTNRE